MYEFKFSRPATVRQAANLLAKTEDAKLIAGGHTLVPVMKQRLARPAQLIDLSKVEGLDTIEMKGRSLVIGAMARHASVAASSVVKANIPALANLASMIGDPAVRHMGTIGGSLANNDPTADYPAAVMALDATIVTNKRKLKPEEFFQGLFTTALARGRDHHPHPVSAGQEGGLHQVPQSGLALCAGRRVRRKASVGGARRRDRRRR